MAFAITALNSGSILWIEGSSSAAVEQVLKATTCLGVRWQRLSQRGRRDWSDFRGLQQVPDLWFLVGCEEVPGRIAEIRSVHPKVPIYVVGNSGGDAAAEAAALLEGADGYSDLPLPPHSFHAKIVAILRRESGTFAVRQPQDVVLLRDRHQLLVGDRVICLSPREYSLLEELDKRAGQWVSRDEIFQKVFGWCAPYDSSLLRTHIFNLRRKLGECEWVLRTHRGLGVMLVASAKPKAG